MKSGRREAVKIVQIETRYIQTDAMNFRDVVQSLTGKNSSTAWVGNNNASLFPRHDHTAPVTVVKPEERIITTDHHRARADCTQDDASLLSSIMLKNVSVKDFDRLWSEFHPNPIDDLPWLVGR